MSLQSSDAAQGLGLVFTWLSAWACQSFFVGKFDNQPICAQGQRLLKLGVSATTNVERNQYAVTSTAPPNAVVAPSSYYMLFAVDSAGVPSTATWVKIG
jgi:hypothetical protein